MEPEVPDIPKQDVPTQKRMDFGNAFIMIKKGFRMSRDRWADTFFVELQSPGLGSKMTGPYLFVTFIGTDGNVANRVPWEPGYDSIFAEDWYTSKYQNVELDPSINSVKQPSISIPTSSDEQKQIEN